MPRITIDFGIDLGTTNSIIACMQAGNVVVLKNNDNEDRTPSVVRIDASGNVTVGRRAYARLEDDPENTKAEFKRLMGTRETLTFQRSGRTMTPEELSAEVLKSLKADAQNALGEEVKAAVITVPAMFELPQCEATQRAAKLAGIEHAPLLQEPIAAALAYGHEIGQPNGYWMVYDLGGGTFDISIVTVRDGRLAVVDHSGDNFLGGKDFDWLLVNFIIDRLNQQFSLGDMTRSSRLYRKAIAKLKALAEDAKIQLTQQDKVSIVLEELCEDQDGRVVDTVVEITRRDYEHLIRPKIEKTIQLCRATLERNRLLPADIERIVLVGAPTKTPYVRRQIQEALGIEVEIRVDPITVVAEGAAVFASSQRLEQPSAIVTAGKLSVDLRYSNVTQDTEHLVVGRISPARAGLTVELVRDDGGWRSGRISVARDGFFETDVNLREWRVNQFSLLVYDTNGAQLETEPDSFAIRHGLEVGSQPLSRSFGVVIASDEEPVPVVHWLIEHNTPLPAERTECYRTIRPVVAGSGNPHNVLDIYIVEGSGESNRPESNRPVGRLCIRGDQIDRSLHAEAEVHITFKIDTSRILRAVAYIPELDYFVPHEAIHIDNRITDVRLLREDFHAQQARIAELKQDAEGSLEPDAELALDQLRKLEHQGAVAEIEDLLKRADEDRDAVQQAQRRLQDLKASLDPIEDKLGWTRLKSKYYDECLSAQNTVQRYGDTQANMHLQRLEEEAEEAISRRDSTLLREKMNAINSHARRVMYGAREFWVDLFRYLAENEAQLTDRARAQQLIATGWGALRANDDEALKAISWELWDYLPPVEQSRSPYASVGIRRA